MAYFITQYMMAKKPIGYRSRAIKASGNSCCHFVLPVVDEKYPNRKFGCARMYPNLSVTER